MGVYSHSATETYEPLVDPNYSPDPGSDEGGFWYKVEKLEKDLQASPYVVSDPVLNDYVKGLVCKLADEYCSSIRVYIIKNPHFNASMYPNGMMHVWSGLLLRVDNEAQLATVLSHEIAHYLRTHQIIQWRRLKGELAVSAVLDVALLGGLATLATLGGSASFSRDQEMEADKYGFQIMTDKGFDPAAAYQLWDYLALERKQDKTKSKRSSFFASHPMMDLRSEYLREMSSQYNQSAQQSDFTREGQFLEFMLPHYYEFMSDLIALREYERVELLIDKHRNIGYPSHYTDFFEGELYRLRNNEGDKELAIAAYERAISSDDVYPTAYRELGYLYLKAKQNATAYQHFDKYLELNKDANDKEMILFYMASLKGK
jgi:predicted Zn-dependent protease